jgi:hypothetical protein
MTPQHMVPTFNSPLEAGIRAISILLPAFPQAYDLQRLVVFDHLIVHTGDMGGPESLHPQLPLRSTEILVRRKLVERGLLLMMSRGLVERIINTNGISYCAGEFAATFQSALTSPYIIALRERGDWVVNTFGTLDDSTLRKTMSAFFGQWIDEFHATQRSLEVRL